MEIGFAIPGFLKLLTSFVLRFPKHEIDYAKDSKDTRIESQWHVIMKGSKN